MKVVIVNPNNIVESAHYESVTADCASIFINTRYRWVEPDTISSIWNDPKYDCMFVLEFLFYVPDTDSVSHDTLSFISENDHEKKELSRLRFLLHDKDQLWYALLENNIYMASK